MTDPTFQRLADSPAFRDALAIVEGLARAGHVAYLAGGCVRDALLGHEPKDYDVATSATPDAVRGLFRRSQGVGESFGVILVRQPSTHVEVATFRSDGDYTDGRRPDRVTFGDEVADARRRDFTINGMFYDPRAGRVIDHVGGRADLGARVVRAIGDADARFAEDYLRILRAVRFAARFELELATTTRLAIEANAPKLARIAPERVADEVRRMFADAHALRAVALLDACSIMPVLMRRMSAALCPDAGPVTASPRLLLRARSPIGLGQGLAAIACDRLLRAGRPLADVVSPRTIRTIDAAFRETFRYTNEESDALRGTLDLAPLLGVGPPPSTATLKRFLARPHAADALRLLRELDGLDPSAARFAVIEATIATYPPGEIAPTPLVTGDDLTAMGFSPSPLFKRVLDATYDAQLEGRITSASAAKTLAWELMENAVR